LEKECFLSYLRKNYRHFFDSLCKIVPSHLDCVRFGSWTVVCSSDEDTVVK